PRYLAGAELQHGPRAVFDQLVGYVKPGGVGGYAHFGSDSVAVVRHIGYREMREIKLIQPAAADDLDGFQAGFIEDPSNFDGQLFEIAAVDSHALKPLAVRRHFLDDLHRFAPAGEGLVSVDEQHRRIRKAGYRSAKS